MLDQQAYLTLEQRSAKLADELECLLASAKVSACVQRVGSMLTLFFGRQGVSDFSEARAADHEQFARFFQAMLREGVHLPPSGYEAWFISLAHDEATIEHTLACTQRALRASTAS